MNKLSMRYVTTIVMCIVAVFECLAQKPSYNHDAAKMNQITVMETGAGALTPIAYYRLLHNNYQKSAAIKNKLEFRTASGIGAYQQVEYADSLAAYLEARAKIEALNMADRQIDLAWKTEGSKINDKLDAFHNNINRIVPAGGTLRTGNDGTLIIRCFRPPSKLPVRLTCLTHSVNANS